MDELLEVAADWHARLESGAATREAFEAWRQADPRHAAAFARIHALSQSWARLKHTPSEGQAISLNRRQVMVAAGGGGVAALAVAGGYGWLRSNTATAETAAGERRLIRLQGGTSLHLNTRTSVSWQVSGGEPHLTLKRGEISVVVPRGSPSARLLVSESRVTVTEGTLNARMDEGEVVSIQMVRGRGEMATNGEGRVKLSGGQGVDLVPGGLQPHALSDHDAAVIDGWQKGELVFEGATLDQVVKEYNRYLDKPILITAPELGTLRIGGRFQAADPSQLFRSLELTHGIRHQRDPDGTLRLVKGTPAN
ncbi:FecR family protein [Asticcacaulis machinosus]|uniref:DUF4880 domain-containing protein n=1 Tax=Asticcacaulis machinosus TaxID=2984211 RepID=A0ABT5HH02_9CAUL|nr:DUF4880 domain-containing protein [Asticcacaulis machinosus]